MRDLYDAKAMSAKFFLGADDVTLIERISKDDESALLQFTFKHINLLLLEMKKSYCTIEGKYELMDQSIIRFKNQIKDFAKEYQGRPLKEDWEISLRLLIRGSIRKASQAIRDNQLKNLKCFQLSSNHLDFLNHLNDFLMKMEVVIIEQAKLKLPLLQQKLNATDCDTRDYEYFVDISFFTRLSDGNPVFTTSYPLKYIEILQHSGSMLLAYKYDWYEPSWMPRLNNRCCYLMHEIAFHSRIEEKILDIDNVWIEYKVWDQFEFRYEDNSWTIRKYREL